MPVTEGERLEAAMVLNEFLQLVQIQARQNGCLDQVQWRRQRKLGRKLVRFVARTQGEDLARPEESNGVSH